MTTTKKALNGDTAQVTEGTIKLRRLQKVVYAIDLIGTAPLIVNRFTEKAKTEMLEAQQTTARPPKEPKDPMALFEASRYRFADGRDGFPASGFKAAIVGAARQFEGVTLVALKQAVFVIGEGPDQLIPITGKAEMFEAAVRNANGHADLRYRARFEEWSATIKVRVVEKQFDIESLYALVDAAGLGGIGEWRPSAPKSLTGSYGTFEVVG